MISMRSAVSDSEPVPELVVVTARIGRIEPKFVRKLLQDGVRAVATAGIETTKSASDRLWIESSMRNRGMCQFAERIATQITLRRPDPGGRSIAAARIQFTTLLSFPSTGAAWALACTTIRSGGKPRFIVSARLENMVRAGSGNR